MKTKLIGKTRQLVSRLQRHGGRLLVTSHGQPAAYLMDVTSYEQLHERLRLLEGIARGEVALRQGRVLTHAQAKKKMARWLK